MIVFGVHCNIFIVLAIRLGNCRSNVFFIFTRQYVRAQKIGRISEVLCAQARPIGIGHAIFSRPDNLFFEYKNGRIFRKQKP